MPIFGIKSANMKFLAKFLVVTLLHVAPARAQTVDSLFLNAAIAKLQHAKEYTLKVAHLMPEEKYTYKPTAEEMSFGEQLLHISTNMGWLCSSYLSSLENPVTKESKKVQKKAEIMAGLNKTYDYAINVVIQFGVTHLQDTVSFFSGPMNKLQIINLLNDHQTHHRGQLLVYLRLNDIKPPDYVGW